MYDDYQSIYISISISISISLSIYIHYYYIYCTHGRKVIKVTRGYPTVPPSSQHSSHALAIAAAKNGQQGEPEAEGDFRSNTPMVL